MIFALVLMLGVTTPLPAAGTYHYAQIVGGKTIATESVKVQWNGTTVSVWENRTPKSDDGVFVESEQVFDALTLSLLSYQESDTQGCGGLLFTVHVNGSQVKLNGKQLEFAGESRFVLSPDLAMPFFLVAQDGLWQKLDPIALDPRRSSGHVAGAPLHLQYDHATSVIDEVVTPTVTWKRLSP